MKNSDLDGRVNFVITWLCIFWWGGSILTFLKCGHAEIGKVFERPKLCEVASPRWRVEVGDEEKGRDDVVVANNYMQSCTKILLGGASSFWNVSWFTSRRKQKL